MKFILVVLIVAGFVCVIMSFLLLFAKYLPFVWDREEWKIWKECWACDVVGYEDRGCTEFGEKTFRTEYYWLDNENYYAVVFTCNGEKESAIFENSGSHKCVFSSYYEPYSNKLTLKLEEWKRNYKQFINQN